MITSGRREKEWHHFWSSRCYTMKVFCVGTSKSAMGMWVERWTREETVPFMQTIRLQKFSILSTIYVTSSINVSNDSELLCFFFLFVILIRLRVFTAQRRDHLSRNIRMMDIQWSMFWLHRLLNFFRNSQQVIWQSTSDDW